jgi:hypothetical protein
MSEIFLRVWEAMTDVILVDIFIYLFETLLHINETNSYQEIVQRTEIY